MVTLPYAQDVFQVGSKLGGEWLWILILSLVPVTVIELAKGAFAGTRLTASGRR